MTASRLLDELAVEAGIEPDYHDASGNRHALSADTKLAFLNAMGMPVGSEEQIAATLMMLRTGGWRRALEPVTIIAQDSREVVVGVVTEAACPHDLAWQLTMEDGTRCEGHVCLDDLPWAETSIVEGLCLARRLLVLRLFLPLGYHVLEVGGDALKGRSCVGSVIVTPPRAYLPSSLGHGGGIWGFALQLYGLEGLASWGIGDFADLAGFAAKSAELGAGILGLNPLHALFPGNPAHASPYSPSSRCFLNPLYINIEAVPDFQESATRSTIFDDSALAALRKMPLVDYTAVARAKQAAFEQLFAAFRAKHLQPRTSRGAAFEKFQSQGGVALDRYVTFEALAESFRGDGFAYAPWRNWPVPYRDPGTPETAAFARQHADRLTFHRYLQWEADRQLRSAAAVAKEKGMPVGLYRDLALGVDPDGADAWAEQRLLVQGISTGAPPDPFNLQGQSWGLPPFNPRALRDAGYVPFIECLRANMRHSGALRIDHIMGFARLFWISRGAAPSEGGYVRYPLEDLLAIAALESLRARCILVGEDLGTVPEGLRERLSAKRILSTRLLYFERERDGAFQPAKAYPEFAHVAIGTHDLPTLPGYWRERDIDTREELLLLSDANAARALRQDRTRTREALLAILRDSGLLPVVERTDEITDTPIDELVDAAYRFLAASPSRLLMIQVEDVLGVEEQSNVPGTVDQHPNWRRKLPIAWQSFAKDPRFLRFAQMLRQVRPSNS